MTRIIPALSVQIAVTAMIGTATGIIATLVKIREE
jgi:hypothetical protein